MSLFFWYVSWASWWNAVLLVNPVTWIGVRPPHLCALSGFRKQCYTVCFSTSSVASGFGLQVNNLLHLWPHVVLNRVFLHEIQVALIRQGAVGSILVMHTISGKKKQKKVYITVSMRCTNTLQWDTTTRTWRLGPNRERCAANEGSLASQTNISLSVKQQV